MSSKAWGGRFEAQPEDWVDDFNASIEFDKNLINQVYKVVLHMPLCLRIKILLHRMKLKLSSKD